MKTLIATLGLGFILTASDVQASEAYYGHGVFNIENKTSVVIRYQVKWGNGSWNTYSLQPGQQRAHFLMLHAPTRVKSPLIRFDSVGGDGKVTEQVYDVDTFKVNALGRNVKPTEGRPYFFKYCAQGRHLELYSK